MLQFNTCEELELFLGDQVLNPPDNESRQLSFFGLSGGDPISLLTPSTGVLDPARAVGATDDPSAVAAPDVAKSDGNLIFALRGGMLLALDASAEGLPVLASTPLEGDAFNLLVHEGHVLVLARTPTDGSEAGKSIVLSFFDFNAPESPLLVRRVVIEGEFVDARRVGDQVMLVTRSSIDWPEFSIGAFSEDENRDRIRKRGILEMLPTMADQIFAFDASPRVKPALVCEDTYSSVRASAQHLVVAHVIPLGDLEGDIRATGMVSDWSVVAATSTSVYIAATSLSDGGFFTPPYALTRVHKLRAFEGQGAAKYAGSAELPGVLVSPFALDEYRGVLRVALAHNASASGDTDATMASVVTLRENLRSGTLVEVGHVDDVAHGRIAQAVRFQGPRAFVVTVDAAWWHDGSFPAIAPGALGPPIVILNLGDPSAPRVDSEISLPGLTNFITAIDDGRILTVGLHATELRQARGLTVSVVDVNDVHEPALVASRQVGDDSSVGAVLFDPSSYAFFPDQGLFVLDHAESTSTGDLERSGADVLELSGEGLSFLGRIAQDHLLLDENGEPAFTAGDAACVAVRRTLKVDADGGPRLVALSALGATLVDGETLEVRSETVYDGDASCTLAEPSL